MPRSVVVFAFAFLFYLILSIPLAIGMMLFGALCLFLANLIIRLDIAPLWLTSTIIFVVAWIGQFYGHKIEGKKPAFADDLAFLLIGPLWVFKPVYGRLI